MSWSQIAQWPVPPYSEANNGLDTETYAAVSGSKIYVMTTLQSSLNVTWQFYEYNPATDTYTAKALPAPQQNVWMTTVNVSEFQFRVFLGASNGHVYFMGGTYISSLMETSEGYFADYNIAANSWSYKTKPGDVGINVGYISGACFLNGKIWISERTDPYVGEVNLHYFDTATNTWTLDVANNPHPNAIVGVYNNEIYLSGVTKFNPTSGIFTEVTPTMLVGTNTLDKVTLEPNYSESDPSNIYLMGSFILGDVLMLQTPFGPSGYNAGSISVSLTDPRPQIGSYPQFSLEEYLAQQGIQYKALYYYNSAEAESVGYNGSVYSFLPMSNVTQGTNQLGIADRRCFKYTPDGVTTAPSSVTPSGTINTDTPVLSANSLGSIDRKLIEWQLATDPAFTVNKKVIFDYKWNPGGIFSPGYWSIQDPTAAGGLFDTQIQPGYGELFQGSWYLRSRNAVGGFYSPWSPTNTITVTHPPALSTISPVNDTTLDFGTDGAVILQWNFSDTSPTDVQTAFQIIVENNEDGTLLLDTGKFSSQTLRQFAWNLPAANKDLVIRWKIRGWDSDDVVGNYSPYALFRMSDKPTVTITAPTDGSQVSSGRPITTWDFAASAARTQASFRVKFFFNGDTLVFDSGVIAGSDQSFQPDEQVLDVGTYSVQVEVTDSRGLSNTDSVNFSTSYDAPNSPVFAVNSQLYPQFGYIEITWGSANQDYAFSSYVIYRRLQGTLDWEKLGEDSNIKGDYSWRDYSAAANVTYEYVVTQKAYRFAVIAESTKAVPGPQIGGGVSEQYWLVHPTDPSLSVLLRNVNSEDFTNEQESEELLLIGRGRHMDYGTRWGYKGTLSAQIRNLPDGTTARELRLRLELLRNSGTTMLLRNPFGDVWQVAISDIAFSRVAGVGTQEFLNVTIPYSEVV